MFADYQELAAAFARQCRERRNAEEEAQRELDELTKPATVPSAADVRKTQVAGGAGAALVFKTRDEARVTDADRELARKDRVSDDNDHDGGLSPLACEAIGQALGEI